MLIPLVLEQFMMVLVGLVDTMMLSGISESALAAFSLVDSINQLLVQVFIAIGAGGSIIAAQHLGNRDKAAAGRTATQTFLMVFLAALGISVPVAVFGGPILHLLYPAVGEGIQNYARQYFLLTVLSFPAYGFYSSGTNMLYAQGQSRLSMTTGVTMNGVKILLNFLFIRALGMDVVGAGLATIISRVIGAFMVTRFLLNQQMPIHYPRPLRPRFNAQTAKGIFRVALPGGIENVIFLTSKLIIGILIAGYPAAMIAANAAANTLSTYISIPANAINLVTITVVSQSVGAGLLEEARKSTLKLQGISVAALAVTSGLVALFINPLTRMLNLSPEAFAHTRTMILVYCAFCFVFFTPSFGLPNALRAAGDNRFVMAAASFTVVAFRLAGSFVLGNMMGLMVHGVWYAMYLDWIGRAVLFTLRFKSGRWLKCRLV